MWDSRTKADLIVEVWEKLDCESVGAHEILEIESAVRERFGAAAVESPMVVARQLADEGAELRHAEIMDLYLERASDKPYDHIFRNVLKISDLRSAAASIRDLENIRRKFETEKDKEGLRLLREEVIRGKAELADPIDRRNMDKYTKAEIVNWITLWLQSPEMFENWLALRTRSEEFLKAFGEDALG